MSGRVFGYKDDVFDYFSSIKLLDSVFISRRNDVFYAVINLFIMKRSRIIQKVKGFLSVVFVATLFFSCNKKDTPGSGQFMFVNASPGFGPVDVILDGNKFNTTAVNYGANTGYKPLLEGSHVMNITSSGTTTSLYDVNLSMAASINQSFFIYDRPNSLQVFAVQDNLITPSAGKANIRFFHLSPGSTVIDVGTVSASVFTPLFSARSFESSSTAYTNASFTSINAGTYSFEIRVNGAGVTILTVNNIVLQEGKNYTLFAKGISGNATTPLGLEIIENN